MFRIIRVMSISMISISLIVFGFYGGSVLNGSTTDSNTEQLSNDKIQYDSNKIAVVNLDEGCTVKDRHIYYSNTLSKMNSEKYHVTSLELARKGIETGEYGAYVVIPANFSRAVESINSVPEKIVLSYSISNDTREDLKPEIMENIYRYTENISVNTSYLYVSAILDDFHKVQDDSKTIIENDTNEMKEISEIDPAKLWVNMEYPEITNVEFNIEDLDISRLFEGSLDLVSAADRQMMENLEAGINSFDEVKQDHDEVVESINNLISIIEEVDIATDENGASIYEDAIRRLNALVDTYNYLQSQKREIIRDNINTYVFNHRSNDQNYVNTQLSILLSDLQNQVNSEEATINSNIQNYVDVNLVQIQEDNQAYINSELASMSNALLIQQQMLQDNIDRAVEGIVEGVREEYKGLYEREWEIFWSRYEPDANGNILASASDANMPLRVATPSDADHTHRIDWNNEDFNIFESLSNINLKRAVSSSNDMRDILTDIWISIPLHSISLDIRSITLPHFEYRAGDEGITNIENLYRQDFTGIRNHIDENIIREINRESINESVRIKNESEKTKTRMNSYESDLKEYTPYRYLNEGKLTEPVNKIGSNIQEAENQTNSKINEYVKYGSELEKANSEDMDKFLESMDKAEKDSVSRIEETMNNVKEKRKSTNKDNVELLKAFSEKLAYTKLGESDNTKVYDFISDPVSVQNIGEEKKQSIVERVVTDTLKRDDIKYLYISMTLMSIGIVMFMLKVVPDKEKK
jgi:hypothetical protein